MTRPAWRNSSGGCHRAINLIFPRFRGHVGVRVRSCFSSGCFRSPQAIGSRGRRGAAAGYPRVRVCMDAESTVPGQADAPTSG